MTPCESEETACTGLLPQGKFIPAEILAKGPEAVYLILEEQANTPHYVPQYMLYIK